MSRVDSTHTAIVGAHTSLGIMPLLYFGNEEQKERYLRPAVKGDILLAFALTEPEAGSDAANIQTTAVREGDYYVLNGSKIFITNGLKADVVIVMTLTDKALRAYGGVTAFIVEKKYDGFSVGTVFDKMGLRGSDTAELIFDNVHVPKENVLGPFGGGFLVAMNTLDIGRAGLGAASCGGAQAALEAAVRYAKAREQFGEPIAQKQAIQWLLADMATDIHAARLMTYNCAARQDKLPDNPMEWPRNVRESITRESAMVKLYCSEMASRVINKAMQIFGGIGYMRSFPLERACRDVRLGEIVEGTSEMQRLIIAQDVIKKGG
jgi:butyryl-CoA dehydrogenase